MKILIINGYIHHGSTYHALEMTGQLKTLFDHFGYLWMSHRPHPQMFGKVVVAISTSAGAGHRNVAKTIARQFFWMGVSQQYRFAFGVSASNWAEVSDARRKAVEARAAELATWLLRAVHKKSYSFQLQLLFTVMRMMQKGNNWSPVDRNHWVDQGWLDRVRPWSAKRLSDS